MKFIYKIKSLITVLWTFYHNNKYNRIASGTRVFYKSSIINAVRNGVIIGENCTIGRTRYGYHAGMPFYTTLLNDGEKSYIKIGRNCRINGAYIHARDFIEIGNNCVIATGVNIIDSNAHIVNSSDRTKGQDIPEGILIHNNVWIGLNVTILKGTVIGNNCVIGAGSVVKGCFEDNSIIQGNPAVIIGKLKL